jgi:hypothetical protein
VIWEEAVGYVEYPDGFSFCVYRFEPGLSPDFPETELKASMRANRAGLQGELDDISQRATQFMDHPYVRAAQHSEPEPGVASKVRGRLGRLLGRSEAGAPTGNADHFDEYVAIKTSHMAERAALITKDTIEELGMTNTDQDGFAYRMPDPSEPVVEVVGFDYEYLKPLTGQTDREKREQRDRHNPYNYVLRSDVAYTPWGRAAYMAMLDAAGELQDEVKDPANAPRNLG